MSAGATAGAAAAARRRRQQEEEEMSTYGPQDLSDGWEFKILRSMRGVFRDPERLKQILADEKRAGWVLVEKFDEGRIRLKRPANTQSLNDALEFDPYRTYVGPSENQYAVAVIAVIFGIIASLILVVVVVANVR